eukprot:gene8594-6033_t
MGGHAAAAAGPHRKENKTKNKKCTTTPKTEKTTPKTTTTEPGQLFLSITSILYIYNIYLIVIIQCFVSFRFVLFVRVLSSHLHLRHSDDQARMPAMPKICIAPDALRKLSLLSLSLSPLVCRLWLCSHQIRIPPKVQRPLPLSLPLSIGSSLLSYKMMQKGPIAFDVPPAFTVESIVGQGAYGAVCKAQFGGECIALKKIPNYTLNCEAARRVLREIEILQQLQFCEQVVACRLFFRPLTEEKDVYVAMDYVPSDLSSVIKNKETVLDESVIRYITCQLLLAVRALHRCNVLHRDISTRNILVDGNAQVFLCDFGLSRFYDPDEQLSIGVVTQWYRAPEIVLDADYGPPSDVWSVGVILGEMLLRYHLFPGKPQHSADQLELILSLVGTPSPALFEPDAALGTASDQAKKYILQRIAANPRRNVLGEKLCTSTMLQQSAPPGGFKEFPPAVQVALQLLHFDPTKRPTAQEALQHPWFDPCREFIAEMASIQDNEPVPSFTQVQKLKAEELIDKIEQIVPVFSDDLLEDSRLLPPPPILSFFRVLRRVDLANNFSLHDALIGRWQVGYSGRTGTPPPLSHPSLPLLCVRQGEGIALHAALFYLLSLTLTISPRTSLVIMSMRLCFSIKKKWKRAIPCSKHITISFTISPRRVCRPFLSATRVPLPPASFPHLRTFLFLIKISFYTPPPFFSSLHSLRSALLPGLACATVQQAPLQSVSAYLRCLDEYIISLPYPSLTGKGGAVLTAERHPLDPSESRCRSSQPNLRAL